jgi:chromosome segregation ATPase
MSVQRQSVPPSSDVDLESTAELPVLDVADGTAEHASSTDTWIVPAGIATLGAAPSEPLVDERSTQLEVNLRALSTSLKDVEERLTRKGERLTELEHELASARNSRIATEERASALLKELAQVQAALADAEVRSEERRRAVEERDAATRALHARQGVLDAQLAARERAVEIAQQEVRELQTRSAGYLETLRSLEGRRTIFDALLSGLDHAVSDREARLQHLQGELGSRTQEVGELQTQLQTRNARIAGLDKEVSDLGGALARRNEQIGEVKSDAAFLNDNIAALTAAVAERDASIAALKSTQLADGETLAARQRDLARASVEAEVQRKNLQTLDAALAVANARLAEEEAASLAALELRNSMEGAIGEQRQRVARLEVELAGVVRARDVSVAAHAALQAENTEQAARLAAASARVLELETSAVKQAQTLTTLQEDLRVNLERARDLEGDLRAAEDSIHRLETDVRMKSARLDELAKTQDDSRGTVEQARRTLAERERLINRLETEAANSQVLLGNIQQSMKRLDPGASGTHEVAPEGAARLFIRTGDSEVVHMLGRKTTIGRTPDNDVQIDAKFISRHHAVILAGPTHTIIEDLNSTNGVIVNGRRVLRQTLKDGDAVLIGKAPFRFAVRPVTERR